MTELYDKQTVIELIPNGSKIRVTEENKKTFVKAVASWIMTDSIKE